MHTRYLSIQSGNKQVGGGSVFARAAGHATLAAALFLLPLSFASPLHAQAAGEAPEASAIVTALPKASDAPPIPRQQIQVSIDGKQTQPTLWRPYARGPLELVILIDGSARSSLGRNFDDLTKFINDLPPNVSVGVAYMQNGSAVFSAPLSNDHATVVKEIHLPGGSAGSSASPYFCLSSLAKGWPSPRSEARREVVMVTDGVDEYNLRYDPEDVYVHSAFTDAQRAGIVVYSIYYRDQGRLSGSFYETNAGQNYLTQVADETGGTLYYEGLSNPVSFMPFLNDLSRRLMNQYELGFPVKAQKKESFVSLKVKSQVNNVKLKAPEHVAVAPAAR